jgi:hypothetical protein
MMAEHLPVIWREAMNLSATNPSTRLKLGALFFSIFWTIGMVVWGGSFDRAHLAITAISGALLGYAWYRFMRWWLSRSRIPAHHDVSDGTKAKS